MATKKTKTSTKKVEETKPESSLSIMGDTENSTNWVAFEEKQVLFVFHWCGPTKNSEWFRKSIGWDGAKPTCELCKEEVPDKYVAIVRLYMSKL